MDLFLDQRKDFEKEKQQFMEAVCRLDREVHYKESVDCNSKHCITGKFARNSYHNLRTHTSEYLQMIT